MNLLSHSLGRDPVAMRVVGLPYQADRGEWWMSICDSVGVTRDVSLGDKGVVPYQNGQWNRLNWLTVMSTEEMASE